MVISNPNPSIKSGINYLMTMLKLVIVHGGEETSWACQTKSHADVWALGKELRSVDATYFPVIAQEFERAQSGLIKSVIL